MQPVSARQEIVSFRQQSAGGGNPFARRIMPRLQRNRGQTAVHDAAEGVMTAVLGIVHMALRPVGQDQPSFLAGRRKGFPYAGLQIAHLSGQGVAAHPHAEGVAQRNHEQVP